MRELHCTYEEVVAQAAQTDEWSDTLRSHAAHCAICSEVALVTNYLRDEAQSDCAESHLPSASYIWWKAQLRARQAAAERAVRPMAILEKVALLGAVVVLVALLRWAWPILSASLGQLLALWTHRTAAASAPQSKLTLVASSCFFVLLSLLAIGLYSAWAEE